MSIDRLAHTKLNGDIWFKQKIGGGTFGDVYLGFDYKKVAYVAIKIERLDVKVPQLQHEAGVYEHLQGGKGFSSLRWLGTGRGYMAMVTDLLGASLDLYQDRFPKFSLKTVLLLADQMIPRLEFLHSRGFIHRDIKPGNFLMGRSSHKHEVYLVDFGLAQLFRSPFTGMHMAPIFGCSLVGTPYYSSLKTHYGIQQSRKDDLEALGYMLISFLLGELPWLDIQGQSDDDQYALTRQRKLEYPPERLCRELPEEFLRYFNYCRGLTYAERPDYTYLRLILRRLASRKGIMYDYVYDWSRREGTS